LARLLRPPRRVPQLFRVPGRETPKLFKFVTSATFRFDPFSWEARAIREVWRDLSSRRYAQANPRAKLDVELLRGGASTLAMSFVDGDKKVFEADAVSAKELLSEIWYTAFSIEFDFLKDNKPLPS